MVSCQIIVKQSQKIIGRYLNSTVLTFKTFVIPSAGCSQRKLHSSPSRVSYGVALVSIFGPYVMKIFNCWNNFVGDVDYFRRLKIIYEPFNSSWITMRVSCPSPSSCPISTTMMTSAGPSVPSHTERYSMLREEGCYSSGRYWNFCPDALSCG